MRWAQMPDLTLRERLLVAVPIALIFVLGIWPQLVLGVIDPTVMKMVQQLNF
jgi:NADH-quinone oxidoreductase subunit M